MLPKAWKLDAQLSVVFSCRKLCGNGQVVGYGDRFFGKEKFAWFSASVDSRLLSFKYHKHFTML